MIFKKANHAYDSTLAIDSVFRVGIFQPIQDVEPSQTRDLQRLGQKGDRMMKLNPSRIKAVSSLPGPQRYSHFIKVAADQNKIWGLFNEGWALAGTDDTNESVFPLWPAAEYAQLCALGEWKDFSPREIDLGTFFEILMPKLRESNTNVAIFPTPEEKGGIPELEQVEADLRTELSRIE